LRPLTPGDAAKVAALATTGAVLAGLTLALSAEAAGRAFLVERRADRTAIGSAGFAATEIACAVELAVWIGEAFWGQGYGTEAAQAIVDRAFAEARVVEVQGAVRVSDARGRRLLEKCGFQSRGGGMARSPHGHGAFPVERFVLGRSTWQSLKAWGAASAGNGDGSRQSAA
jgi:RimJ/RimL family protein N-acetyltransferase